MGSFKIAETLNFQKKINKVKYKTLYSKIENYVYPILRNNPFYGANIKKLKGEYTQVYRYRIGNYRLFYTIDIDKETVIIFVIDIEDRKDSY